MFSTAVSLSFMFLLVVWLFGRRDHDQCGVLFYCSDLKPAAVPLAVIKNTDVTHSLTHVDLGKCRAA